ncbi:MAG: hypothetical protein IJL95_01170, partial [Solobacterium sp.]|nr:hypothetical protein [Solobacterium sp.]
MLRKINRRVLGLDIGVTSVGYGVIDLDTGEAVDYGVRLFDESNPKANQDRRSKRSGRRMKRRRYNRLRDMRILLEQENLIPHDYKFSLNPYEARTKGLHNKLKNEELATALYNLAKMRGNSLEVAEESTTADDESVKAALQSNDELLKTGLYVCEIQQKRLDENKKIRGHQNNFRTADYLKETSKILENQEVSEEFKKSVLELIARRRDFSDGPGSQKSPTPYGRWTEFGQLEPIDLIEKMRGKCSIYPDEMRAPKMSYQAELFNFLNDLNNLNFEGEKITPEQKEEIIKIIDEKGSITPKALAKFLQVPFDQ